MLKAKTLKPGSICLPSRVYGVDFSGAKKAGNKIWIASALFVRDELIIEDCFQAKYLASSTERDSCLQALCHFISSQKACAFGLDFPFSLPKEVIKTSSWEEFVLSFGNLYPDPMQLREICCSAADNHELKRRTDEVSQTPFSPYNLRLYRQTYYGIRNVLAPLVRDQLACVLPMQRTLPSRPWLLEICPASTLKQIGMHQPYKGHDKDKRAFRAHILKNLGGTAGAVIIKSPALRSKVLDDPDGDAIDSVIAAFATLRAVCNLARSTIPGNDIDLLEGYVYI